MLGNFSVAAQLAASQEGPSSMKLVVSCRELEGGNMFCFIFMTYFELFIIVYIDNNISEGRCASIITDKGRSFLFVLDLQEGLRLIHWALHVLK
jgi:hypothetical protein